MTHARAFEIAQQLAAEGFIVDLRLVPAGTQTIADAGDTEHATVHVSLERAPGRRMTLGRLAVLHSLFDRLCVLGDVIDGRVLVIEGGPRRMTVTLRIDGKPAAWQRQQVNHRTRTHYDGAGQKAAKAAIRTAWMAAGRPRLSDTAPLTMTVEAVLERPDAHWLKSGALSASGERTPWPTKKPDFDNLAKVVADALNGKAYRDDAQIVLGRQVKRWANPGETEHTVITIAEVPATGALREAA